MKVFNLSCQNQHTFEGWFRSAQDFETQRDSGLLTCPVCGDSHITKGLSAPRLNVSGALADEQRAKSSAPVANPTSNSPTIEQMQALWYKVAREVIKNTEDVGDKFVEEARKIHYQEAPERAIRGRASPQEREELANEGIDVYSMPLPVSLKEPLQ
jgi:hypothetical protein